MTGPPGARINRDVAIVTDDFRLYHQIVPLFESHEVPLLGLAPGDAVPDAVQVLLGGPADDPRSLPVLDDLEATLLSVLARLDGRPTARDGYGRVVIGLDPGDVIGIAIVADGVPLLWSQEREPEAAVARIERWKQAVTARAWIAHIGDGAPQIGVRLEGLLHQRLLDVGVRFVPEEETSPGSPATDSRHTDAAIHIAMRRPAQDS